MSARIFDIPGFTYFSAKNVFSGSASKTFNYKIWFGDVFAVKIWYGLNAFETTPEDKIIDEFQTEFSEKGLEKVKDWILQKYNEFNEQ
ncbi:MAG: hypothetical protein GX896_10490 [Clostridiales bacterium]|nr:hypothetical protein [Clostridiales bacterium]